MSRLKHLPYVASFYKITYKLYHDIKDRQTLMNKSQLSLISWIRLFFPEMLTQQIKVLQLLWIRYRICLTFWEGVLQNRMNLFLFPQYIFSERVNQEFTHFQEFLYYSYKLFSGYYLLCGMMTSQDAAMGTGPPLAAS